MANVRLRTNLIADGKFYARGSLVDEALVPEHLHEHVDRDLENREWKVLLLRDLSFMSLPRPSESGTQTSFPIHVMAGELIDLAQVPASTRASLVEGTDYRAQWTHDDLAAMRIGQGDIYAADEQLRAEPVIQNR